MDGEREREREIERERDREREKQINGYNDRWMDGWMDDSYKAGSSENLTTRRSHARVRMDQCTTR
jgi:hypothetical protein